MGCNYPQENKTSITLEEAEINLREQLDDKFKALIRGDEVKVANYLYPGLFEWLDKEYPDEFSKESYVGMFVNEFVTAYERAINQGVESEIVIGEITKSIDYQGTKVSIILVDFISRKGDRKVEEHSQIISISEDNGKTWKFIEKEEGIDEVLSLKFPSQIVDRIID